MFISHNGTPYEREEVRMRPGRIMNAMIWKSKYNC